MSLSAEEDDIPWDNMRDNRDLTVFTSWDPKERYFNFFFFFRNWDSWLLTGWCIQVLILAPMSHFVKLLFRPVKTRVLDHYMRAGKKTHTENLLNLGVRFSGSSVPNFITVNQSHQPRCFFLSQTVNWWTPAAVPGGGVHLAQDTLPYSSPARFFGRTGAHALATKLWDDQWERSGRQDVGPQRPAVPAQPDFTDGCSDGRKTPPGESNIPGAQIMCRH